MLIWTQAVMATFLVELRNFYFYLYCDTHARPGQPRDIEPLSLVFRMGLLLVDMPRKTPRQGIGKAHPNVG